MSTEQQDTREQQIDALARHLTAGKFWPPGVEIRRQAAALLDGPVARMIADAQQAAAVKALRSASDEVDSDYAGLWLFQRAARIENGSL